MSDAVEPVGGLVASLLQEILRSDAKHQHGLLGIAVVEGIAAISGKKLGRGLGMATLGLDRSEDVSDLLDGWLWDTFPDNTPLGAKLINDDYPFKYNRPWYFWITLTGPREECGFWLARHEVLEWLGSDDSCRQMNEELMSQMLDAWRERFLAKVIQVWHEAARDD